MSAEVELRMLDGSEFQTAGAAMLKPRETKVVRTHGNDRRLVLTECRERVGV